MRATWIDAALLLLLGAALLAMDVGSPFGPVLVIVGACALIGGVYVCIQRARGELK